MLRVWFLFKDALLILIPLFVVATLTVNTGARVEGYIFADSKKNKENPFERQNYLTDEYMPNRFDEISKGWDGWVNSLNCRISILALR